MKMALAFSDAIVYGGNEVEAEFVKMAKATGKPILNHVSDEDPQTYIQFIENL